MNRQDSERGAECGSIDRADHGVSSGQPRASIAWTSRDPNDSVLLPKGIAAASDNGSIISSSRSAPGPIDGAGVPRQLGVKRTHRERSAVEQPGTHDGNVPSVRAFPRFSQSRLTSSPIVRFPYFNGFA